MKKNLALALAMTCLCQIAHAQEDSVKYFRAKLDSIYQQQKKKDSIAAVFLRAKRTYKFRRVAMSAYIKMASGFVAIDRESNNGLVTVNQEYGVKMQIYFKQPLENGIVAQAATSLYVTAGWGPTLVQNATVPNYLYGNLGLSIKRFGSDLALGVVAATNTSGDEGSPYLYGLSGGLDGIPTPFFFSCLVGAPDSGFEYMIIAGFRIQVLDITRMLRSL